MGGERFLATLATKNSNFHIACALSLSDNTKNSDWTIMAGGLLSNHTHANLLIDVSTVTAGHCTLLCFSVMYSWCLPGKIGRILCQ